MEINFKLLEQLIQEETKNQQSLQEVGPPPLPVGNRIPQTQSNQTQAPVSRTSLVGSNDNQRRLLQLALKVKNEGLANNAAQLKSPNITTREQLKIHANLIYNLIGIYNDIEKSAAAYPKVVQLAQAIQKHLLPAYKALSST